MARKPIPFPHLDPAAEPEPIVKHREAIVIRLGSKRYAIDITTSARPLPLPNRPRAPKSSAEVLYWYSMRPRGRSWAARRCTFREAC
jgi:hypothetical protein